MLILTEFTIINLNMLNSFWMNWRT